MTKNQLSEAVVGSEVCFVAGFVAGTVAGSLGGSVEAGFVVALTVVVVVTVSVAAGFVVVDAGSVAGFVVAAEGSVSDFVEGFVEAVVVSLTAGSVSFSVVVSAGSGSAEGLDSVCFVVASSISSGDGAFVVGGASVTSAVSAEGSIEVSSGFLLLSLALVTLVFVDAIFKKSGTIFSPEREQYSILLPL